jgi:caffeoyl-CoA O-methyltransferase
MAGGSEEAQSRRRDARSGAVPGRALMLCGALLIGVVTKIAHAEDTKSKAPPPAKGTESAPPPEQSKAAAAKAPPPADHGSAALDAQVRSFLEQHRGQWHDLNVPFEDGQQLYNWIVERRFTRALEIGTSTGHSGIWIAWALSKTGGKLITLELDPARHRTALANFAAAGVSRYVDARLGNAHDLVKQLPGPYDFVFSDADKGWYTQYFKDLESKLTVGGCFTAHNVLDDFAGVGEFLGYARSRPNFTTTIARTSPSGISLSCRSR